MMVVTSFMAVVCSGMASLKWRTSSTRPNEVQPCEPCITGMQSARPRKARLAPRGWLILSGLTVQAFFDSTTLAMVGLSGWVDGVGWRAERQLGAGCSDRDLFGAEAQRLGRHIAQVLVSSRGHGFGRGAGQGRSTCDGPIRAGGAGRHRTQGFAVVAPGRRDAHLLPHRVEQGAVDLVH